MLRLSIPGKKPPFSAFVEKVVVPVLLAGAAYVAFLSGVYILKIVILQYDHFASFRWTPEVLGPTSPWLSLEEAWGIDINLEEPQKTTLQFDEHAITYHVTVQAQDPVIVHFETEAGLDFQCGSSKWRRSNHLPPQYRVHGTDAYLSWSGWRTREEYLFCLPPDLWNLAQNDLVNHRVTQLYQTPGFINPIYAAWFVLSILICEPMVPGHTPSTLDPYQHLYGYPW